MCVWIRRLRRREIEDISFDASDRGGETIAIDAAHVREQVAALAQDSDLGRFIL